MKQAHEKDEINANALSSILHLKHLAELHAQEKDALEKKSKAASQLALAARLAANAKDRLEEEAKKEKEVRSEILLRFTELHMICIFSNYYFIHNAGLERKIGFSGTSAKVAFRRKYCC